MSDPAPRKPMTPSERARHASLVRWGKERPFAARLAAVREARKKKKGKAGPKPKAKKPTPEERAAAAEQEAQANRAAVMDSFGSFGRSTLPGLEALAKGEEPANADGMIRSGLAEKLENGTVVLTAEGKKLYNAASKGDAAAAKEAIARAESGVMEQEGKEKAEKEKADAAALEEEKPKGGGGGGGKEKPSEEEKDAEKAEARKQKANDTAAAVGMKPEELDALRLARDEGGIDNPTLLAAGLIGPDGLATDQGRRALTALENGNIGQYRAALQDAAGRMGREKASEQREADTDARNKERDELRKKRDVQIASREAEREKKKRERQSETDARRSERRTLRVVKMDDETEQILTDSELAIKAGRMLSTANAEALLSAYEAADATLDRIGAVLEAAGLFDEEEEELDEMPGGMAEAKTIQDTPPDLITNYGSGVKAMGDGWVGGYLVRFGGEGDFSEFRDIFTKATDFGRATKSDVWVHHRVLPGVGKRRLQNQADIGIDDEGVFIKHLLNLRSSYERKLYGLVQDEKLGWSSGTAPHLVERKALGDGRHEIEQWPLGLDASYTPTPAGGLVVNASAMKTLMDDAGIDLLHAIYTDTEAETTEDVREGADPALKTDAERVRRLSLRRRYISLQE